MIEKKVVVDRMLINYTGPFEVTEFYKIVEDWKEHHGREKEIKKKSEEVSPQGKNIEWSVELWKFETEHDKIMTRVKAFFKNVREIKIEKAGAVRKLNHGDVVIVLDAFLETDYHHEWTMTPWFYFLRIVFDRFIWNIWTERYVGKLRSETMDLHKQLTAFFRLYQYSQR